MANLSVSSVTVRFSGNLAVNSVDLTAESGCVTGLIGPNGAGKTTLFNVITGLLQPTAGRVTLDGEDITKLSPYKRARKGLARTFQAIELWDDLSVYENVSAGMTAARMRRLGMSAEPSSQSAARCPPSGVIKPATAPIMARPAGPDCRRRAHAAIEESKWPSASGMVRVA